MADGSMTGTGGHVLHGKHGNGSRLPYPCNDTWEEVLREGKGTMRSVSIH